MSIHVPPSITRVRTSESDSDANQLRSQPTGIREEISALFRRTRPRQDTQEEPSRRQTASSRRTSSAPYTYPRSRIPTIQRTFCILSSSSACTAPNHAQMQALSGIGLGLRRIQLRLNGTAEDVHEQLTTNFPELLSCGGYELLRASPGSRLLTRFTESAVPVTAQYLNNTTRASTNIYVRPIQRDLSRRSVSERQVEEVTQFCISTKNHLKTD